RMFSASRRVVLFALAALGVTCVVTALGYSWARQSDEQLAAAQHEAVRTAVAEFRALFGKPGAIDPRLVRMTEQGAGLQALKFETDPAPGDRDMQPVLDGDGRIAGFFTWQRSDPMTGTVRHLAPLMFGIVALLVGFAGYALRQLRRSGQALAA